LSSLSLARVTESLSCVYCILFLLFSIVDLPLPPALPACFLLFPLSYPTSFVMITIEYITWFHEIMIKKYMTMWTIWRKREREWESKGFFSLLMYGSIDPWMIIQFLISFRYKYYN
jgi:hypothetical protein